MVAFSISRRRAAPMLARITADDLRILAGMLAGGTITPVIEHTYRLDEVGAAFRHLEKGHTKGKLVVVP
jgi:NADPH:quinone reductase-like Zn-dependent oxidoreductase